MFFLLTLTKHIEVQPQDLGPQLKKTILSKLFSEVEGTCTGQYGYIIAVTNVKETSTGRIRDVGGAVMFAIEYQAVVFRPFRGEVLDAIVTGVNKFGFFAQAGPLRVFVAKQQIPDEFVFDHQAAPPQFVSSDDHSLKIKKDDEVRLRVMGSNIDAAEIVCVGSIKDDYLGVQT